MKKFGFLCGLLVLLPVCQIHAAERMTEIRAAHFPPLPDNWSMDLNNKTVIYKAPAKRGSMEPESVLHFTHTRATGGKDAQAYMDEYVGRHGCDRPTQLGKGFYSTSCQASATDAIVVGEPNNIYLLEISGEYSKTALKVLNTYLNDIITGKHTFDDRDIGEKIYRRRAVAVQPQKPAEKKEDGDAKEEKSEEKKEG